jgi:copper chaperone NosL
MALVVQPSRAARRLGGRRAGLNYAKPAPLLLLAVLAGCSPDARPFDVRAGEACAHCRMAVSDARFAGQIAAPGEEPLFYDDIGCLARAVAAGKNADYAWVADHRTREWVPASRAVFTRVPGLETPMSSHLIAHASEESRKADAAASGGKALSAAEVFAHAH